MFIGFVSQKTELYSNNKPKLKMTFKKPDLNRMTNKYFPKKN